MPTIPPVYPQKKSLDKDFIGTSIYITEQQSSNNDSDSLINKKMSRIIFKIKKYYIIYIQNKKSIDFNMPETVAKNILIYRIFNKKDWDQKTKKYGYQYID